VAVPRPLSRVLNRRRRAALRHNADRRIALGDSVPWRERELTSLKQRSQLARSLNGLVRELANDTLPGASPLNRVAARPQIRLLRELADVLDDGTKGIYARGVVLLEELLVGPGSPLYDRARAAELERALLEAKAGLLVPRRAA
jgi:hypothetical protein